MRHSFMGMVVGLACSAVQPPKKVEVPERFTVCEWYRAFDCPEGEATPEGATCEDVIANTAESGIDIAPDPECLRGVDTCEQARQCPTH
jgi:hypothetical protein